MPPTTNNNIDLFRRYRVAVGDERSRLRTEILTRYASMVKHIASRISRHLPHEGCRVCVSEDDLRQEGMIGLCDALDRFNPDNGFAFATFATRRVWGAMMDAVRKLDHVKRNTRKRAARAAELADAGLSLKRIAKRMKTSVVVVGRLLQQRQACEPIASLSSIVHHNPGSRRSVTLEDLVGAPDNATDPAELNDWWDHALDGFSRDERLLMTLYYRHDCTMKEIGQAIGFSESRASQIHSNLIQRMRSRWTQT